MGAIRMRVQTADKNIALIHTTSPSLTSCEVKSCFVDVSALIKLHVKFMYRMQLSTLFSKMCGIYCKVTIVLIYRFLLNLVTKDIDIKMN